MNHFFKASILAATLFSTSVWAATTGNLVLRGNVPAILSIEITAEAVATELDLSTSQTDLKVASVEERSNSNSGYQVSVSSLNSGSLVRAGGSESINYTMKYNGAAVDLSAGSSFNNPAAASVTANKDVTISYTGQYFDTLVAGNYEDTVTFTISAN
jgi:hypothetical protein